MSEQTHLFVVFLSGDIEDDAAMELVGLALESAGRSGKQVVVDLSGVQFMGAHLLGELLKPGRGGGRLPWLCGPLSSPSARTLEVTGTDRVFRIFPTLTDAKAAAYP
ncbi:STAS domain-containing protein [Streptomyces longhuiensis]|uniref:STAS domain-containing protein n=1 Tax=Streptomyces longhuiensis TaxID=2880933 RepID=UPI001D09D2A0|nr:STAS domain-containing protein [Streptomyces longhuiensis]UDM05410.1 STAS domain-containing protein [Streptomyces longhuiensis]